VPGQNKPLVWGVFVLLVVGMVYGALYFYKSSLVSSAQSIDNDLASLEQKRDKPTEEKLLLLSKKLAVVGPLLASHIFWSEAFIKIQQLTATQVQFKNLNASLNNKEVTFKAEAANYTTVARQIASFLSDKSILNVSLGKVSSLPTGRVEMGMSLTFDPVTFLSKPK